jgi:hypothetical protein
MNEIWKDIPGWEGYYQVSNLGRVRSLDRTIIARDGRTWVVKGGVMRARRVGAKQTRPYLQLQLWARGERIDVRVHRLVAWAFLGDPPAEHHVHHLNGDATDNRAGNLAYVPTAVHCSMHTRGAMHGMAKLNEEDVATIKWLLKEGWKCSDIARVFGVSADTISNIRTGRRWVHVHAATEVDLSRLNIVEGRTTTATKNDEERRKVEEIIKKLRELPREELTPEQKERLRKQLLDAVRKIKKEEEKKKDKGKGEKK